MSALGSAVCLTLVGAQLIGQVVAAFAEWHSRQPREPRCPPVSTAARRDYLEQKADVEHDARRRL